MKSVLPLFLHRRYQYKSLLAVLFIIVYVTGCTLVDHPPAGNKYLVSSSLIGEVSKQELGGRLAALNLPLPPQLPPAAITLYDIKVYKIVYKTRNPAGQEVEASGALIIPKAPMATPMISQQHGTILADADAPSHYNPTSEAYFVSSIFASSGYIISCPDYLGYGASGNGNPFLHTYEHREGLAQASMDMIRASKEFIASEPSIKWDTRLYLSGYSEGGFATMSLYKKIQDEASAEFNVRAVSAGAGAYDKTSFMKELLTKTTHGIAAYNRTYLWVLLTYDHLYGLNRPLETYFVEPYLTEIKTKGLGVELNVSFDRIFTDSFKKGITDGTDTQFLAAVADNNVYDWKPLKPLQLYHGTLDPQVFYLNSVNAFSAMISKMAPVQLISIPGGTHQTSQPTYILGTYTFFKTVQ